LIEQEWLKAVIVGGFTRSSVGVVRKKSEAAKEESWEAVEVNCWQ